MTGNQKTMADVADKGLDLLGNGGERVANLIDKVVDGSSDVFDAAGKMISRGIELYGKDAIDAVLWIVRIDAIGDLARAFAMLIVAAVVLYLYFTRVLPRWACEFDKVIFSFALIVVTAFVVASPVKTVTDVWKYVAVVKPELYLAKQAITAVQKKVGIDK